MKTPLESTVGQQAYAFASVYGGNVQPFEARSDGPAELPRLVAEALREELASAQTRCVLARHRAGLLAHPQAGCLASLDRGFTFSDRSGLTGLPRPLGKALRRAGVSSCRAREALIAEVQYLALVLGGLADDFAPWIHLAVVEIGELVPDPHPWPGTAKVGLLYAFDVLEEAGGEEDLCLGLPAGTAAVLKLDGPHGPHRIPTQARRTRAGRGGRRLMLWVASERQPDWNAAGRGAWARLTSPEPVDVLLVSMPFGPVVQPSLGLGLLKNSLPPGTAKVLYLSLVFARRIGRPLYHWLSDCLPFATTLAGEWLFAQALSPELPRDPQRYLEEVLLPPTSDWFGDAGEVPANVCLIPEGLVADLLWVRDLTGEYLDRCVEEVLAHRPKIVGFTSVFQQHAASLALARRLKARAPEVFVVLGGSNCEGVMGLATVRGFDFVDAVVSGEGEVALPQLVERRLAGRPVDDLRGVYTRRSPEVVERVANPSNAASPRHLDDLPYPDFDDFFTQFAASGFVEGRQSRLLFETSRGCWWGEKKHCTFCGLNGAGMTYRSKSAERALAELRWLTRSYPGRAVSTVDNILDMQYFKTFLPHLAEERLQVELFYEVKANLKKDQIRLLRAAGVTSIQAGVESFSDEVLQLMGKGVKGLQNIRLLKWCEELGVWPFWNMLWGFPGESPEEYARVAELIPYLHHLPPPVAVSPIFLERFSPNFFRSGEMGFAAVRPTAAYEHIYPLTRQDLSDIAFFFHYEYQDRRDVDSYVRPLVPRIWEWRDVYAECNLAVIDRGDHLLICDTRPSAVESMTIVDGMARTLYLACDDIATIEQLAARAELSRERVEETLRPFLDKGLALRQGEAVLALAVTRRLDGRG